MDYLLQHHQEIEAFEAQRQAETTLVKRLIIKRMYP